MDMIRWHIMSCVYDRVYKDRVYYEGGGGGVE